MTHLDLTPAMVMTALGWAVLKATVILGLATFLTRVLRRRTAALRHLIWTTALASIVAVLVLPIVLPAWRVIPVAAVLPVSVDRIATRKAEIIPPRVASPIPDLELTGENKPVTPASARPVTAQHVAATSGGASWPAAIVGLWLLGVAAVFFRYVSSRAALLRMARWSTPSMESGALVRQISRQMRITRPVCLRTSDEVDMPFTWGVFHPQIVLPGDAFEWSPECRRHVLQHELAHIRRLDAGTQLVAQAATTLFWFHPLVWYAVARMRCERERACDDYVLATGAVACDYASDLLALVSAYGSVERHAAALAFARRSHFEGRLLALLDPTIDRGVLSPRWVTLALSIAAAFVVPFAALESAEPHRAQPTAQTPAQPVTQRRAVLTPSAVSRPATIAIRRPAASVPPSVGAGVEQSDLKDVFAACAMRTWNHDSDQSSSGDGNSVWTVSARNGECSFDLKSEGDVVFNRDATAIEHMTPGGFFDVTTTIHDDVTRLVVRASATGALSYELTQNGRPIEFSLAGSAWLAQTLIGLDRTTAFAIDHRFPLLAQAGADNVLAEVEHMYSAHAKFVYLRRLIENVRLDAGAVRRTSEVVATMRAGHEAGEVILAIASHYTLEDAATRVGFLKTALALDSDNEQGRALVAIMTRATLSGDEIAAVLRSVARMNVDHEKSRVLLGLAGTQRLDGEVRNMYVMATETIRDARMRDRTLNGLVSR